MSEYQPQMTVHSAVELVVAVVDTAQAESVLRVYRENRALVSFECMARGTEMCIRDRVVKIFNQGRKMTVPEE